jgi:hypothetical protein
MKSLWILLCLLPGLLMAGQLPKNFEDLMQKYGEKVPTEWLLAQAAFIVTEEEHEHKGSNISISASNELASIYRELRLDSTREVFKSTEHEAKLRNKIILFIRQYTSITPLKKISETNDLYKAWLQEPEQKVSKYKWRKLRSAPKSVFFFNHVHTKYSKDNDAMKSFKFSPLKTLKVANGFVKKRNALGSMSFNDHENSNAYSEVIDHVLENPNMTAFRGAEFGGKTHMGLVGIKNDWPKVSDGKKWSHENLMDQARDSLALRIVNHPGQKSKLWTFDRWLDTDGIEVWNSILEERPMRIFKKLIKNKNNREAMNQWVKHLEQKGPVTAMSGSDFHFYIPCLIDRGLFYPTNIIPGNNNNPKFIRQQVQKGNVSILTKPTAPKLNLQANWTGDPQRVGMGDNLKGHGKLQIILTADYSDVRTKMRSLCYETIHTFTKIFNAFKKEKMELRFYTMDSKVPFTKVRLPKKKKGAYQVEVSLDISQDEKNYIRAELWQVNKKFEFIEVLGITNPIYLNY